MGFLAHGQPSGSRSHFSDANWTWGYAWGVPILPFTEQNKLYDKFDFKER